MDKKIIDSLPSSPGVYVFKKEKHYLYIGKSVNIKARVKSHFENARISQKEAQIVSLSDSIDWITVDSDFKALLLESSLIKKYSPKYNSLLKDGKSYLYLKITVKEKYPKVFICHRENDGLSLYFGPFSSYRITKSLFSEIRKIVPFCTQKKDGHPCFYSKIGLCSPCPGQIGSIAEPTIKKKASALYKRNIRNVIRILSGNPEKVVKSLNAELNIMSKSEKYEEAIKLRDRIYRLKYLVGQRNFNLDLDADFFDAKAGLTALIGVLKKYYPDMNILRRIECYDVSHFGQKQTTGSMVVMNEGVPDLSQYRRFRVKKEGRRSDFDSLAQVIKRRFANDWPYPDLIVVDGGRPQVKKVISEIRSLRIDLPVIGIAKDPDRLIAGTDGFPTVKLPINHTGFNLVRLVRDESHRFAKKYHLLLRRREMI